MNKLWREITVNGQAVRRTYPAWEFKLNGRGLDLGKSAGKRTPGSLPGR